MAEPVSSETLTQIARDVILPRMQDQIDHSTRIVGLLPAPSAEAIEAWRLRHAQEERELVARVRAMSDDELLVFLDDLREEGY